MCGVSSGAVGNRDHPLVESEEQQATIVGPWGGGGGGGGGMLRIVFSIESPQS